MGMNSLPFVIDDRKNMKHTIVNMLGVPKENIFEVEESTFDQLEDISKILKVSI